MVYITLSEHNRTNIRNISNLSNRKKKNWAKWRLGGLSLEFSKCLKPLPFLKLLEPEIFIVFNLKQNGFECQKSEILCFSLLLGYFLWFYRPEIKFLSLHYFLKVFEPDIFYFFQLK